MLNLSPNGAILCVAAPTIRRLAALDPAAKFVRHSDRTLEDKLLV